MPHYFLLRRNDRGTPPDYAHHFVVKADSAKVPEHSRWVSGGHSILGYTQDEEALKAMQRLHMNRAMREWLRNHMNYPMIDGWGR